MALGGGPQEFPSLLPLGFHPVSVDNLRQLCVDRFPQSITRGSIMDGLADVIGQLNATGMRAKVWVDGSFLTEKLNPRDSDILVNVEASDFSSFTVDQLSKCTWINTNLRSNYKCDAYLLLRYSKPHPLADFTDYMHAYWLRQYGFSRADVVKGMAVVDLPFLVT